MTHQNPWLDADVAKLIELWRLGKTTREIGIALHRRRNSIISKAQRLRSLGLIQGRDSPINVAGRKPRVIVGHSKNGGVRLISPPKPKADPAPPAPIPSFLDSSIKGKPFGEQKRTECVWPLWDKETPIDERCVCARPVVDTRPYCAAHFARSIPKEKRVAPSKTKF